MNPDSRLLKLQHWLSSQLSTLRGGVQFSLAPASEDASFRRYFRVSFTDGSESFVAMDAPPEKENCRPFLHVGALFAGAGAHVPKVHASSLEQGFLLLEDLGPTTYLDRLNEIEGGSAAADDLYPAAIDTLVAIQLSGNAADLRPYDDAILRRELNLFPDWYIARHLRLELSPADGEILARA